MSDPQIKLKYIGNGEYIMGVPARDLTAYDLENVAHERGDTVEQVIAVLTSLGVYSNEDKYICQECGNEYVSYDEFHKHSLTHVEDKPLPEVDEIRWEGGAGKLFSTFDDGEITEGGQEAD